MARRRGWGVTGRGYRPRPPREQGRRHPRTVVYYTDLEWTAIAVAAAVAGMTPGAWAADAAYLAARDHNAGPLLDRESARQVLEELRQQRRVLTNIGGNLNQLAAHANATGQVPDSTTAVLRVLQRVMLACEEVTDRAGAKLRL